MRAMEGEPLSTKCQRRKPRLASKHGKFARARARQSWLCSEPGEEAAAPEELHLHALARVPRLALHPKGLLLLAAMGYRLLGSAVQPARPARPTDFVHRRPSITDKCVLTRDKCVLTRVRLIAHTNPRIQSRVSRKPKPVEPKPQLTLASTKSKILATPRARSPEKERLRV